MVFTATELELGASGGELLPGDGLDSVHVPLAVGSALALVVYHVKTAALAARSPDVVPIRALR